MKLHFEVHSGIRLFAEAKNERKKRNLLGAETVPAGKLRDVLVVVKAQRTLELIFLRLLVLFEFLVLCLRVRF